MTKETEKAFKIRHCVKNVLNNLCIYTKMLNAVNIYCNNICYMI